MDYEIVRGSKLKPGDEVTSFYFTIGSAGPCWEKVTRVQDGLVTTHVINDNGRWRAKYGMLDDRLFIRKIQ